MATHANSANPPAVKRLVLLIGAVAFAVSVATAAEAITIEELRAMAEAGDAEAQVSLGGLFYLGHVVVKDEFEATKWFRKAAEQGLASAQYNLGVAYASGQGVAKDEVEAYAWINLGAIKEEHGRKGRDILEKTLSREEIAAGQRRTRELQKEIEAKRQPPSSP